jgi:uncharacterized protein (DUF1015 family)
LIADGHHRYETALNYSLEHPGDKKKGCVLATLVSSKDEGLEIWPTHRLLNADALPENAAIEKMKDSMHLVEMDSVEEMCAELPEWMFGLIFRSGRSFVARCEENGDPLWSLDTYVAQELIIKKIYGYDKGDVKVAYDAELDSVKKKMENGMHGVAIVFNAPSLSAIWNLSSMGKRMPKKTTFFYPKIWSGFVIYKMA